MSDYNNIFGKMIDGITNYQEVSDEYEKLYEEKSDLDVFNFSYFGDIELEHDLIYLKAKVLIEEGKFISIKEIHDMCILNREGKAIKHYINPYGADESICKFILWNMPSITDLIINLSWDAEVLRLSNL